MRKNTPYNKEEVQENLERVGENSKMNKDALKVTSKVLTGLVLLTGVTSVPANAVEVKNAAVDVNAKEVKVSVYEKDGHYYAKLVSDKEVSNVVARIVVDGKSEL